MQDRCSIEVITFLKFAEATWFRTTAAFTYLFSYLHIYHTSISFTVIRLFKNNSLFSLSYYCCAQHRPPPDA